MIILSLSTCIIYVRLKSQIEELDKSINMITELKRSKAEDSTISTHFRISDQIYSKARIPPTDKVGLWLGVKKILLAQSALLTLKHN